MEVAAGMYTRILFPAAVSNTHPVLTEMQKAMLDSTLDCIKVLSVDGRLRMMNRAGCTALNVPEDSGFGMPWLPLLPEDVRAAGEQAISVAASGKPAQFCGKSESPTGTVYWDNLLTPLIDRDGNVVSILCISRDVTKKTVLENALAHALERETLLAHEMRHRIRNILSVVTGLVSLSTREAASSADPGRAIEILKDKLGALARASDAVFAQEDAVADQATHIDLNTVVSSVLQPYGARCTAAGESTVICQTMVTTVALLLHELATNAVKYGALAGDEGGVHVSWKSTCDTLHLRWQEKGGPGIESQPASSGFGTQMVDRVIRASGGAIERRWRDDGLTVDLALAY